VLEVKGRERRLLMGDEFLIAQFPQNEGVFPTADNDPRVDPASTNCPGYLIVTHTVVSKTGVYVERYEEHVDQVASARIFMCISVAVPGYAIT
jgi:hypothetical protein